MIQEVGNVAHYDTPAPMFGHKSGLICGLGYAPLCTFTGLRSPVREPLRQLSVNDTNKCPTQVEEAQLNAETTRQHRFLEASTHDPSAKFICQPS